jgi:hypothetical protein
MASHDQTRARNRGAGLTPIERGALSAKNDIQDVLYRMAERHGFSTKAADRALRRHLDELLHDMIHEAEQERRVRSPRDRH